MYLFHIEGINGRSAIKRGGEDHNIVNCRAHVKRFHSLKNDVRDAIRVFEYGRQCRPHFDCHCPYSYFPPRPSSPGFACNASS
jgi:hypothetical protein